jgi:hypothetical protein
MPRRRFRPASRSEEQGVSGLGRDLDGWRCGTVSVGVR